MFGKMARSLYISYCDKIAVINHGNVVTNTVHFDSYVTMYNVPFQWQISDNTAELTKQKNDVTEELETTKSTLNKKEEDCLQIQEELDDVSFHYLYCRLNT